MNPFSVKLSEAHHTSFSLVGGKAHTLGMLSVAGFRVPPAVVVTTAAPETIAVEELLASLNGGTFAVRSSGVNEDGPEKSLAGRYRSILDVDAGSVADAVTSVREFAHQKDREQIAVLVQEMIHPVCAGVAFTADPVTGDRATTIITATSGVADRLVSGEVAGDEWRVTVDKLRPVRRPERILDRRLVRRVAHLADRVATELGQPQDIEWAWDGRNVWVIQARPITRLPDDVTWDPPAPGVYHRSFRFGEWIPEPVTPLFESWLLTRMEERLHEFIGEEIGQIAPKPLHVMVNGWYFYSMNWMPVPGVALTRNLGQMVPKLPKNWRKVAGAFPQTVRFAYRVAEDKWRSEVLPAYRRAVADAGERVRALPPEESIDLVDELADLAGLYFAWMAVVAGSAYKLESRLATFWNRHLRPEVGLSHMVLLQGLKPSEEMRRAPQLETLDWSKPPIPVNTTASDFEELTAQRITAETRSEQILAVSSRKLTRFRRLLADAQHLEPVREEQVSQLGLAWPVMRRAVLRLGEALRASGSIGSVDDVFYLTRGEVVSLLEDPVPMFDQVRSRRAERDKASQLAAPLMVGRVPGIVKALFGYAGKTMGATKSERALAHGVPASPGRATGPVRIVRDSSEFETIEEGDVLVAPLTAPAWADLFSKAAAVVTDVGNALAHASIVAREYGIPAVVGCGDATRRLHNGQMVTVDGSTGVVEPAAPAKQDGTTRPTLT